MNRTQKSEAKRKIAELVLTEIENHTQAGVSPVDDSTFKALSPKYSAIKKKLTGSADADLHLKNKMISSIKAEFKAEGVNFKITKVKEKKKAFNHITGDTVPKRSFLPNDAVATGKNAKFNSNINKGIRDIIKEINRR